MQLKNKQHPYSIVSNCRPFALSALLSVFVLTSCSIDNGKASFHSSAEAANAYHCYLSEVRQKDSLSIDELSAEIKHWRQLSDSVLSCLKRDTIYTPHANYAGYCRMVHDSIRSEMIRIALSEQRTLWDVLYLKEHTSPYADDAELRMAAKPIQAFYSSLDSTPIYNISKDKVLSDYRRFLSLTLENGIHSTADMLGFIQEEDRLFRSFLAHLHELDGTDMTDITKNTERCLLTIFQAKDIPESEVTLYISLRTTRRLIQNARTCLEDIKADRVKSDEQTQAYLWMLLQPYSAINDLSLALLSDTDKAALYKLAEETPAAIGQLCGNSQEDTERMEALPQLLIKILIIGL